MSEAANSDQQLARALGQAFWRQLFIQGNPDLSKEDIKARLSADWVDARREYTRLGFRVLRQLRNQGYVFEKAASDEEQTD